MKPDSEGSEVKKTEKDEIVICRRTLLNLYIVRTLKNTINKTKDRKLFLDEIINKFKYERKFINESFD